MKTTDGETRVEFARRKAAKLPGVCAPSYHFNKRLYSSILIRFLIVVSLLLPLGLPPQAQTVVDSCTTSGEGGPSISIPALQPDMMTGDVALPQKRREADAATQAKVVAGLDNMPLYFIENRGQMDRRVAYYVQGRNTTAYFTNQGLTLALTGSTISSKSKNVRLRKGSAQPQAFKAIAKQESLRKRWAIKVHFPGANPNVRPIALDQTPAVISHFKGPKEQWKTGLNTYSQLVYPDLWPGIDMIYSGTVNRLKYSFVVKPGADPNQISMAYKGATKARLNKAGQLEVMTPVGSFKDEEPYSYQDMEGRQVKVATAYRLEARGKSGLPVCKFRIGLYDKSKELVVDPVMLVYAGYIGGSGFDLPTDIAVDSAGNAYITGITDSTEASFPVTVGPDLTFNGAGLFGTGDAFVVKVNAAGTGLLYAGYIGGSNTEEGAGIAVDGAGNAYIIGQTDSTEASFPVTVGPDLTYNGEGITGPGDAFVAKVNAAGTSLLYAGYVGGAGKDQGSGIAVDSAGNAYITGLTDSTEASFPVMVGPDLTYNGSIVSGGTDAFVAKVNAAGTGLLYAGYIGGSGSEAGAGITVDGAGNAYITGSTDSTEETFPVTVGPDLTFNGIFDAFIAKVTPGGTGLLYAGYFGGVGIDASSSIAVDSVGNAYITGFTDSTEASFPVTVGPDLTFNDTFGVDAFVAKVNAAGTGLLYAGYIGGASTDIGAGIAVDSAGNAYIAGRTASTEASFPVAVGPDLTYNGGGDTFIAKVNTAGTGLLYAGYVGGSSGDNGTSIALNSAGNIYIVGQTESTEESFPVTVGPDLTYNGNIDTFVVKIRDTSVPPIGFDICLQDDSTRDFLQVNSATGEYQFARCGSNGFTLNGTARLIRRSSLLTLEDFSPDRRVLVKIELSARKGNAAIQSFSQGKTITIMDRDTSNNSCACP